MRHRLFSRLAGDQRGVAAVEFALLAPILIFFYFGLAEFCQGYMAQKRMGHVAAMVADMVAQEEVTSSVKIDDVFAIGDLIMNPFPTTTLEQRVSSVTRTAGVARVDWSHGTGMEPRAVNSTITLPADLIANGESIIVSEATYDYDSPADYLMPSITRFSHIYYLRPRTVDKVICSNC
ncbi:MAG: TadE/TadG family type IV pilus assembly protein [Brevundimonas sp.]